MPQESSAQYYLKNLEPFPDFLKAMFDYFGNFFLYMGRFQIYYTYPQQDRDIFRGGLFAPPIFYADIDYTQPDPFQKMPFITQTLRRLYLEAYRRDDLSTARLIGIQLAMAHLNMAERSMRARSATLKQHYAQFFSRCFAFYDNAGIWSAIYDHIRALMYMEPRQVRGTAEEGLRI